MLIFLAVDWFSTTFVSDFQFIFLQIFFLSPLEISLMADSLDRMLVFETVMILLLLSSPLSVACDCPRNNIADSRNCAGLVELALIANLCNSKSSNMIDFYFE